MSGQSTHLDKFMAHHSLVHNKPRFSAMILLQGDPIMKPSVVAILFVLTLGLTATGQTPTVGQKAPTFKAKNHLGKEVTFPVKGTWSVLSFYPRASSPG